MKNFNLLFLFSAALMLVFFSCSKVDQNEIIPETTNKVALNQTDDGDYLISDANEIEEDENFAQRLSTSDLYLWKVTFPFNSSGQLSGNNDATESKDIAGWLDDNPNNNYFYTNSNNNRFYFVAPHNGATTSTSGNPRCELREREEQPNGSTLDAYWDGSNNSSSHFLRFTCRVQQLPSSNRLTFAQVHDRNSTLDDVIQIGIKPNPNAGNALYVTLQGSLLTGSGESAKYEYLFPYTLNTFLSMKIKVKNNVVSVIRKNGGWSTIFSKSIKDKWSNQNLDDEYFKAGCYLQGNPNSGQGKVEFRYLKASHYGG